MTTIRKTLNGLWSLIVGLKVTGREFCKPWLTVHYPRQEVSNLNTYRGHIELVSLSDNPGKPKCVVCRRCEEICPSDCIRIEMHTPEEGRLSDGRPLMLISGVPLAGSMAKNPLCEGDKLLRVLDGFYLNYNMCSLCGLCVQNCPVSSLAFSQEVYLAGQKRSDFEFDLLQILQKDAYKPIKSYH